MMAEKNEFNCFFKPESSVPGSAPAEGCNRQPFELSYSYSCNSFLRVLGAFAVQFFFSPRGCMDL